MAKLNLTKDTSVITKEELLSKLPEKKNTITDEVVEMINKANNDPAFSPGEFIEKMIDYKDVMLGTGGSIKSYINALKFCAFLESEDSAVEAYKKARADDDYVKSKRDAAPGTSDYNALSYVASRYRKENKMVRQILAQSDMPLYLIFQKQRYKAVQRLADEMDNAPLAKDRIAAAEKLLTHVKPPENQQIELSIGMDTETKSVQQSLNEQLMVLASNQKKLLDQGVDIKDVQRLGIQAEIIEAEVTDG